MVRHFLECGGKEVLWINPYPGRLPRFSDLQRPPGIHNQGTAFDPLIRVIDFPAFPLEPLPGGFLFNKQIFGRHLSRVVEKFASRGATILGVGKPCALALDLLKTLHCTWSFYDAMDDFPRFHKGLSRLSMARLERAVCLNVEDILVSSSYLKNKFLGGSAPVKCIHNACNPDTLPILRHGKIGGNMVIGYIGSIGEWFDWECVRALAQAVPSAEIRLVGPHLVRPPRNLPQNIIFFPACRQEKIGDYLKEFTIGLIPFRSTLLTQGVDPIKYYEYRAMGLPILSTSFGEMALRTGDHGVFFLNDFNGVEGALKAASSYHPDPKELGIWRAENSWSTRFANAGLFISPTRGEQVA